MDLYSDVVRASFLVEAYSAHGPVGFEDGEQPWRSTLLARQSAFHKNTVSVDDLWGTVNTGAAADVLVPWEEASAGWVVLINEAVRCFATGRQCRRFFQRAEDPKGSKSVRTKLFGLRCRG